MSNKRKEISTLCFFQGEWTTPKELQCSKTKACSMCNENIDTARLVQPNESKRRSKFESVFERDEKRLDEI